MADPKRTNSRLRVGQAQDGTAFAPKVIRPLLVTEVAALWRLNLWQAHSRIRRAVERGQLTRIELPGTHARYFQSELEALFGAPASLDGQAADSEATVKATYADSRERANRSAVAA